MGSWVTALPAQASDMSGWLLMGLPGAIYLVGMVTGTVVLVLWKQIGLSDKMYKIVPGFAANCLTILLLNLVIGQKDESILKEFDEVINEIKRMDKCLPLRKVSPREC